MESNQRRVISLLVDNQSGVLARVSNLFCRRGFNIDSLTVSATNDPTVSRITVSVSGTEKELQQLILQTERLEVTRQVFVLNESTALERELCLSYLLRGLLHMLMHPAALEGGDAGAALLQDLIVRHELQEGVDLLGTARQLKDHAVGRQVDDLCLVNAGNLPQIGAVLGVALYL